jgi:hypothetical protein
MKDEASARGLLEALDSQVSVEIAGATDSSPSLVFP